MTAAISENSSNSGCHIALRTFCRRLGTEAGSAPVHPCSVNCPAQRLDGTKDARITCEELKVTNQDLKARVCSLPGPCEWKFV